MKLHMDKDALDLLQRAGLNQYESRLYLALLGNGATSAGELAELASIPRPRAYDVLTKLERTGFVSTQPGRPVKFKPNEITEAFGNLKKSKSEILERELAEIDGLATKLNSRVSQVQPDTAVADESVWVLKDRKNIYSKLHSLIDNSQKEILISTTKEGLKRKYEQYGEKLKAKAKAGVDVKFVAPKHSKYSGKIQEFAKITHKEDNEHRMVVADNDVMLFLTNENSPKTELGAWIRSAHFANNVKRLV
ncbi:MAG: helix-turn-helix domain-containing protein [Candidatus Micrarchaeota archaeon]